jgi:hypothetical protein
MEKTIQDKEQVCKTRGIRRISMSPGKRHEWGQSITVSTLIDADLIRAKDRFQSDTVVAFFSPDDELYPASTLKFHLEDRLIKDVLPVLRNQAQIEEITNAPTEGIYDENRNL